MAGAAAGAAWLGAERRAVAFALQVQKIVAGSWEALQQLYEAPLAADTALQQTAPQRWAQDTSPLARLERLARLPQVRPLPCPSLPPASASTHLPTMQRPTLLLPPARGSHRRAAKCRHIPCNLLVPL